MRYLLLSFLSLFSYPFEGMCQRWWRDTSYKVELQASVAHRHTPLWLNANRYGLSSLEPTNGYLRGAVVRPLSADSGKAWAWGYGLDMALPLHYTSKVVVQQAFAQLRWKKGLLTVGSKEEQPLFNDVRLSSGALSEGCNARPVPQVRLSLCDYAAVPLTKGWLGFKGHIAYGRYTDGGWQKEFTGGKKKYSQGTWYHSKSGLLRIGDSRRGLPWSLEMGLDMVGQFGGTHYDKKGEMWMKGSTSAKAFWHAFTAGGVGEGEKNMAYQNVEGNQLGAWLLRLNINKKLWSLSLYGEKYFEDHSAMFLLDYDGYGKGEEWHEKKKRKYLFYSPKDMLLGAEVRLHRVPWLSHVVVEYTYQKYQSGPIYHDHTKTIADHIGGDDNYYNHFIFPGFVHWGQVCGNPLFLSPIYNDDHSLRVKNNRFKAWHIGLEGQCAKHLTYRALATWQDGLGTYENPYVNRKKGVSTLLELRWQGKKGWSATAAYGCDAGSLRGSQQGVQLTLSKVGLLGR